MLLPRDTVVLNKYKDEIPEDAVYIGRGSTWGNPFVIGRDGTRDEVCDKYETEKSQDKAFIRLVKSELRGKNLVCFCKPHRCHGDWLIKITNGDKMAKKEVSSKPEKSKSIKEVAQSNELNTKKTFALTYRPKVLKDLCGHDSVVNQLRGMVKERDVPNALMLVGGSGVGKTTIARMVTRYLNCDTFDACGKCNSCKLMDVDSHPDLAEINCGEVGIDEAKGLIQKAMYKPRFRLRVMFLDEVHLLPQKTMQVFLKILEEPPSHTMWILATTNPEKIPNTAAVCGRCTPLVLNPPTKEQMAERLAQVCKKEGIKFDEEILLQIAEQAGGHVRDSLQLLESISRYVKGLDGKVKGSDLKKAIQEQALKSTTQEVDRVAMKVLLSVYNNNLKGVIGSLLDTKEYVPLVNAMLQLNQYMLNTESVSKHPTIWHNAQCTTFKGVVTKKYEVPTLNRMCQIQAVLNQLRNDIVTTQVSGTYLLSAGLGGLCSPKRVKK